MAAVVWFWHLRLMQRLKILSFFAAATTGIFLAECAASTPAGGPAADGGATESAEAASPFDSGALVDAGGAVDAGEPVPAEASCVLPPTGFAGDETCGACLQASCCEPVAQCFEDPACVVINSCLTSCFTGLASDGGIPACEERCHPDASGVTAAEIEAELACFTGACATACPGPPLCGTPTGSFSQTCSACQIVGGTLTCDCVDQGGGTVVSALDLCGCAQPPLVANTDGALTCQAIDAGD
jgi:hypothetical protein